MKLKDSYSVFVTTRLKETKDFYMKWFGFTVFFESTFFILLEASGDKPYLFGFMDESHPSTPPTIPAINNNSGVFLTLEVDDVKSEFARLQDAGIPVFYPLTSEAWGQKRFGIMDPNGMYIDIVEQTEPEENYWEQYMV